MPTIHWGSLIAGVILALVAQKILASRAVRQAPGQGVQFVISPGGAALAAAPSATWKEAGLFTSAYSSAVTYVQALVICTVALCATAALLAGRLSEVGWVSVVGPIVGYVFGVHGTITGANGVVSRIEQIADDAERGRAER